MRCAGTHLLSQHSGGGGGGSDIQGHSWLHRELESSLVYERLVGVCVKWRQQRVCCEEKEKEGVGREGRAEGFFSVMEDGRRLQDSVSDQPGKMQGEGEGNISNRAWNRSTRAQLAPEPSPPPDH